jgi:hypothetical protein
MSTTVKVILAIVGFLFLMVAGTCTAAYLWFDKNKERLKADMEKVVAEAETYGKAHEERECLTAALERVDGCPKGAVDGAMCNSTAGVFLDRCLGVARQSEGFCEGVPPQQEIMEGVTWAVGVCEGLGRGGQQPCGQLVTKVIPHCERRR